MKILDIQQYFETQGIYNQQSNLNVNPEIGHMIINLDLLLKNQMFHQNNIFLEQDTFDHICLSKLQSIMYQAIRMHKPKHSVTIYYNENDPNNLRSEIKNCLKLQKKLNHSSITLSSKSEFQRQQIVNNNLFKN